MYAKRLKGHTVCPRKYSEAVEKNVVRAKPDYGMAHIEAATKRKINLKGHLVKSKYDPEYR